MLLYNNVIIPLNWGLISRTNNIPEGKLLDTWDTVRIQFQDKRIHIRLLLKAQLLLEAWSLKLLM